MKKRLVFLTIISIILNVVLVYFFVFRGEVIQLKDNREAIILSKENRAVVMAEMRSFLESVQQINQGILEENPDIIINAGKTAGHGVVDKVPKGLMRKLPIAFKKLGFATHDLFDEISQEAKNHFNLKKTQNKLNNLLNNCVACHKTYKIEIE